jgi:hypothetical protein
MVTVSGKEVVLGKPADYPSFGFDNEYGSKAIKVGGGHSQLGCAQEGGGRKPCLPT